MRASHGWLKAFGEAFRQNHGSKQLNERIPSFRFVASRLGKNTGPKTPAKILTSIEKAPRTEITSSAERAGKKNAKNPPVSASRLNNNRIGHTAPALGSSTARWDLNGQSFPKSSRASASASNPHNKKLYRVVRDVRTGKQMVIPVKKDMITTPNSKDLKICCMGGGIPGFVNAEHRNCNNNNNDTKEILP